MPLDFNQFNKLVTEATTGCQEPSIPGAEAKKFFERIKKDFEKAKREGRLLAPPNHSWHARSHPQNLNEQLASFCFPTSSGP